MLESQELQRSNARVTRDTTVKCSSYKRYNGQMLELQELQRSNARVTRVTTVKCSRARDFYDLDECIQGSENGAEDSTFELLRKVSVAEKS